MKASDGVKRIDAAVERGRKAILEATSLFTGTLPPPPWPDPELYKAIDDARDVRDRLQTLADAGDAEFDPTLPKVKFVAAQVEQKALAVERLAARLEGRKEIVATQTPAALVASAKRSLKSPVVVLGLLGVLFLMDRE